MKEGQRVYLTGYHLVASVDYYSANATAVVVHNHSTHYLVMVVTDRDVREPLMSHEARFVTSFRYDNLTEDDSLMMYRQALMLAVEMAVGNADDASGYIGKEEEE